MCAFVTKSGSELRRDGLDGLLSIRPFGDENNFVLVEHFQSHDADHTLGVGLVVSALQ